MDTWYRIVTEVDTINYILAEDEKAAREFWEDIADPHGTDHVDARIFSIRRSTVEEMENDMAHNNATCWNEDML